HDVAADPAESVNANLYRHPAPPVGKCQILMNAVAAGQTCDYTAAVRKPLSGTILRARRLKAVRTSSPERFFGDVPPLQLVEPRSLRGRVAVFRLSGDSLQEVCRQPAAATRVSSDYVQCRRRRVDLDSRRLGGRNLDRARAGCRSQGPLPPVARLPFDYDHGRAAGGPSR